MGEGRSSTDPPFSLSLRERAGVRGKIMSGTPHVW